MGGSQGPCQVASPNGVLEELNFITEIKKQTPEGRLYHVEPSPLLMSTSSIP